MKECPRRAGVTSEGHVPCSLWPVRDYLLPVEGKGEEVQKSRDAFWRGSAICPTVDRAHDADTILFLVAWTDLPHKVIISFL